MFYGDLSDSPLSVYEFAIFRLVELWLQPLRGADNDYCNTMNECDQFPGRLRDLCEGRGRDGRPDPPLFIVRAFRLQHGLSESPSLSDGEEDTEATAALVDKSIDQSATPADGPGFCLEALFRQLEIPYREDCNCRQLARQMDVWGVDGCRAHFDEIVEHLRLNAEKYSFLQHVKAAALAVAAGLFGRINPVDPFPGLVEEVLRRAASSESLPTDGPHCGDGDSLGPARSVTESVPEFHAAPRKTADTLLASRPSNSIFPGWRAIQAPQELILSSDLSPGDIVVMTAAVRELHRQHPGRFVTGVRTPCPAIWENNPYITPIGDDNRRARHIAMHYDGGRGNVAWADINRCNQHPAHFISGYCEHLGNALGLPPLRPLQFKGDIHLSPLEKSWISQVDEITGRPTPFWIVNAGGKNDYTCKIWPRESFQEVVDHFRGRLTFVQVGEAGHLHPVLDGVIDLRGKTDLRQLVRLTYHSRGVLCGVTLLMHLAAAVESPPWVGGLRPCVVLGGGREPVHWEAYPGHQFLHTIGALPCCAWGGCWRSRAVPLGDGSVNDKSLCERPIDGYPECMRMITPENVIEAIELYQKGYDKEMPRRDHVGLTSEKVPELPIC